MSLIAQAGIIAAAAGIVIFGLLGILGVLDGTSIRSPIDWVMLDANK